MKRNAVFAAAAAIVISCSILPGCANTPGSSSGSASTTAPIPIPKAPLDTGGIVSLPDYFDMDQEPVGEALEIECTAVREDMGVEISEAYFTSREYMEAIKSLDLYKAAEGETANPPLDIEKPFTLRFSFQGKTDAFSFSSQGIRYQDELCIPNKLDGLYQIYEIDDQGFLKQDLSYFSDILYIGEDPVLKIDLHRDHYDDSVAMTVENPETISKLIDGLSNLVVRKIEDGEQVDFAVGGASDSFTIHLKSGRTISLEHYGRIISLGSVNDQHMVFQSMDFEGAYTAFGGVPTLKTQIEGQNAENTIKAFDYDGNQKHYENDIPIDYFYEEHAVIPIGGGMGKLVFSEAPKEYTVELAKLDGRDLIVESALTAGEDGTIILPEAEGEYFLITRAVYDKGQVTYQSGFLVSDMPPFFDKIDYGNSEGDVLVTRDDVSLAVQGGQNRQYVQFINSLDLKAADPQATGENLPILYPFSLTFQEESSKPQTFSFQPDSPYVTYNGKPYLPGSLEPFLELTKVYSPWEGERPISVDVMDFFAAEIQPFTGQFPFQAEDITSVKKEKKVSYQKSVTGDDKGNTVYNQKLEVLESTEIPPGEFEAIYQELEQIPAVKMTLDVGAYDYGRYTSYEITLQDGTIYTLDQKILVNGEESGYYMIPPQRER